MTDQMQAIREELAFMKALASDDRRLPGIVGAHFLAAGLIYGLPIFPVWAASRGLIDIPQNVRDMVGVYSTIVYLPVMVLMFIRGGKFAAAPPSARAFGAVWSSVGLTTLAILAVIFTAAWRLHEPRMWQLWPAVCFALYGAAWWSAAALRRSWALALVGAGSYATAVINGFLIGTPELILGCAIGIMLWLAGPGLVMMLKANAKA
jgi:hypothetical protein